MTLRRTDGDRGRGQVLVIVAVGMVVFLGLTGLVIDVGGAYAEQRQERAVADAAALAGVQDVQRPNSRQVGAAEWANGRTRAMENLRNQLDTSGAMPNCPVGGSAPYSTDVVNCPLGDSGYYVSVYAPAPTCAVESCDPERSVQVTVRRPDYGLVFARLFDQFEWNIAATSVAELTYSPSYNLVTLRPPKPSRANRPSCAPNCDANENNVFIDGTGTQLRLSGDLGTNTNITLAQGIIVIPAGRFGYHYDGYVNWTGDPQPRQLSAPIEDPMYPIPSQAASGAPTPFADEAAARDTAGCDAERDLVPDSYGIDDTWSSDEVRCYKPGIYSFKLRSEAQVKAMVLEPGTYFFNAGLDVGAGVILVGGYEASEAGVALIFPSGTGCSPGCAFTAQSAGLVALNAGAAHPTVGAGAPATAAEHWDGTRVQTNGDPPVPMTLIVNKDPRCVVGTTEPADCPVNTQLSLPGGGNIYLTGIQYAATDNSTVRGGSGSNGYIGQFISWTVHFTGGSIVNLTHAGEEEPGIYRIATPCSPREACVNPEANAPIP